MKRLISLYREIRRSAESSISPREALALADHLISIYDNDQHPDENEWGHEIDDEDRFVPIDMILTQQGHLLKQERFLLEEVYEDDLFYPKYKHSAKHYEWAIT